MKVFLSLSLLFSLVSPAVLGSCRQCENFNGTECTANSSGECEFSQLSCKSAVVSGDLLPLIPRADYSCDICKEGNYAFTTVANGFFSMAIRCCKGHQCNAKPLEIPSEPMKPNGRECTGCYVEDQEECKGVEVVRCTGNQTKCMKLLADSAFNGIISVRGCATPDMCNKKKLNDNMLFSNSILHFSVECLDAL